MASSSKGDTLQPEPKQERVTKKMATMDAYDMWAKTYDHDGNVLQKIDDIVFNQLLEAILPSIEPNPASNSTSENPHPARVSTIIDIGCGTGRNTIKLLDRCSEIIAIDYSEGMIKEAKRSRFLRLSDSPLSPGITWIVHDINRNNDSKESVNNDKTSCANQETLLLKLDGKLGNGVISTLVLEHVQLETFFSVVQNVLIPGGWFLLTNMHPEMGSKSQAGFVQEETGVKIQPISYNHEVQDILECAERHGFRLCGDVVETGVRNSAHATELGVRAQKWIGINIHVAMIFEKRSP